MTDRSTATTNGLFILLLTTLPYHSSMLLAFLHTPLLFSDRLAGLSLQQFQLTPDRFRRAMSRLV